MFRLAPAFSYLLVSNFSLLLIKYLDAQTQHPPAAPGSSWRPGVRLYQHYCSPDGSLSTANTRSYFFVFSSEYPASVLKIHPYSVLKGIVWNLEHRPSFPSEPVCYNWRLLNTFHSVLLVAEIADARLAEVNHCQPANKMFYPIHSTPEANQL